MAKRRQRKTPNPAAEWLAAGAVVIGALSHAVQIYSTLRGLS